MRIINADPDSEEPNRGPDNGLDPDALNPDPDPGILLNTDSLCC
jgi:hypothetical protein